MTLSEKLSTLLSLSDLSIHEVSRRTGIPSSHLKKMITKLDYNPKDKDIEILAKLFNLPVNGLMNPSFKIVLKSGVREDDILFSDDISKELNK